MTAAQSPQGRTQALARCAHRLAPGLGIAVVVALAGAFAAQRSGGAPLVYALLLGVALHWAGEDPRARSGLAWAAGPLLRLGVGLLGIRLSLQHLQALGIAPLLLTVAAMASTLGLGLLGARWLGQPWTLGLLAGGANAVCGASATLALSAALPRRAPPLERHTAVVAASATALSTLAMLTYPALAHALGLDALHTGLFLGGSIQDVAQVVAAGYGHSQTAGDAAVTLKLARVALLGPLVAAVAVAGRARGLAEPGAPGRAAWVPGFVWLFILLMLINSTGRVEPAWQAGIGAASQACITVAMAALGMRISLAEVRQAGWRPFSLVIALAAWMAGAMAVGLSWL